jgi:predicted Zn-dependent protease
LEKQWNQIDDTISSHRQRLYQLLKQPDGQRFVEIAVELLENMPWLMSAIASWTPYQVIQLRDRIKPLVLRVGDPMADVSHFPMPPSNALISLVASYAQKKVHLLSTATKKAVAGIPVLGSWTGMDRHTQETEAVLSLIRIGRQQIPTTPEDWSLVEGALRRAQKLYQFGQGEWKSYERAYSWPDAASFCSDHDQLRGFFVNVEKAIEMKQIAWKLNMEDMIAASQHCQSLDTQRCGLTKRIQELSEALVNATVVAELNRSFSDEALSALIHFSQIAGKSKFQKSNLPKMSQRQRRHRQEYLNAFEQCCRYIPCWILTTSQISDFLPPECLFDLVIVDETSQSDITVLPTLLRGRQWLIVGDGKQVSPTETFISEDQMDHLRSALPQSYFDSALLPGQSFFDLCAQAFPTSRVSLSFLSRLFC